MFKKAIKEKLPRNLLFIFEVLALFLLLIYQGQKIDRLTMGTGLGLVLIIYLSNYILTKVSTGDNYIFLIVTMLISIGIIMIYRIDEGLGIKQLIWLSIGIFIFFITYFILKYIRGWENWFYIYMIGAYALFLITFIFGSRRKGAINWVNLGKIAFQPSEIIKLLLIFILGAYYSNISKWKEKKYSSYCLMGIVYSFIVLLFLQRDLGTSLVFYAIFIAIQFIYEEDRKLILYNIGLFTIGGILGYTLFDHVKIRFQAWLNPWKYIERQGYQITQSLFAIAEGGFFGSGLGLGHPDFIPVVYTDFIFSAICEEMGIFTGIGIIMLFMILVYRGFKIGISQENKFYKILALGISTLFGVQSFIILGGVLKMIPLTGLTLPFVSYGGSSIVSSFMALGVLQVCSEEIEIKEVADEQGE
ncbi:FtsW/RodA/SpoVE family cell cycle protein [Tissierella praeacuta]|uniref:FtsW/RodA/SpoVE family cell cycle protein n=1 Tax=Tissierella praeacuta TaxID=43131 RepID=UPI0033413388